MLPDDTNDAVRTNEPIKPAHEVLDANKLAYSIDEACEIIGCGRTTLYGEIAAGRLKARKFGSRTKILPPDLVELIRSWPLLGEKEQMK